jgi:hypothetical protein
MLQTIRDHTHGWIAGTIVSVLIFIFALWGISAYFTGGNTGAVLAKVNGAAISKERFSLAYEQARRQLQAQGGPAAKQDPSLKNRVLDELIVTEALKQDSLAQKSFAAANRLLLGKHSRVSRQRSFLHGEIPSRDGFLTLQRH